MTIGVLTEILNDFVAAFSGGFERLRPAMSALFSVLASIDVLYFGFLVLFDIEAPVKGGLRKLFGLTAWAFVAQNFGTLATSLVDSFAQAGLIAAGQGGANARVLLNPSAILSLGFKATDPLTQAVLHAGIVTDIRSIGIILLAYFLIMFAYTALALNALVTFVEYYIALAVTAILVPFGVFAPTRWMAMKPLSYFLATGLKLMVLSFLMATSHDVLARAYFASQEPTMRELWIGCCCALGIALLAWLAPQRLAAGIMSGSASLGASEAVGVAAGAVTTVIAATRGGASARAGSSSATTSAARTAPDGAPGAQGPAGQANRSNAWHQPPSPVRSATPSVSPVASATTRPSDGGRRAPVLEGELVGSAKTEAST